MAKAVISSTYDDKYLFYLPLVTWCWNRLGVDVICFLPKPRSTTEMMGITVDSTSTRYTLAHKTCIDNDLKLSIYRFECPEHKEATYSQCSRLYAACLNLQEDEILIISDIDMCLFRLPPYKGGFTVFGSDLVPDKQFPMCYISAEVKYWREALELYVWDNSTPTPDGVKVGYIKSYQEKLDELLGGIEAEHFRGNYWGKDQEESFLRISSAAALVDVNTIPRARPGTQFAEYRIDRDDNNWRSYMNENLIDAHLWRPGYTDENFANIMELMTTMYPNDDFTWLVDYRNEYLKLL